MDDDENESIRKSCYDDSQLARISGSVWYQLKNKALQKRVQQQLTWLLTFYIAFCTHTVE
jgi:hypothetical protein